MRDNQLQLICTILLLMWSIAPLTCAAEHQFMLATGARYDIFKDMFLPTTIGYELTLPVSLTYTRTPLIVGIDTAFSSANVYPGQGEDAELHSLTDTHLSLSYGLPNLPVGLILGVDVNLPTGRERLDQTDNSAEAGENHDLFEIDDFGAGFNLGVSLSLAEDFGPVSLGINGTYRMNGAYDPTRNVANDDFNPGDQILLAGLCKWQAATWLNIQTSALYTHDSPDQRNEQESGQEGDRLSLNGKVQIRTMLYRPVRITTGLQYTLQGKNRIKGVDGLETEPENSNGQKFFGVVDLMYDHSPLLALRMLGDIRYYTESDRQDTLTNLPYAGQRVRYAFGPGFIYTPTARVGITALLKYFTLTQERDVLVDNETTFHGVNLSVGLTYKF